MPSPLLRVAAATTPEDLDAVSRLFADYAASLDVDLSYQGFAAELATLPGAYAPPRGALLLARAGDATPLGCVALRSLEPPHVCEMKRLYLVPDARGGGAGRALVESIVDVARSLGYRELRLDTLPSMRAAAALYERIGFVRIAAYYDSPIDGTLFFSLAL